MTRWPRGVAVAIGIAVAVAIGGCGRFGFTDPSTVPPAGDGATGDAASDTPTADAPPEFCNGVDDDGDGVIDEGCPCTPFDAPLASTIAPYGPELAWLGDRYVVAATLAGADRLAVVNANGSLGSAVALPSGGYLSPTAALAWNGSALAVAWGGSDDESAATLDLVRYSADLVELGAPVTLTTTGCAADLAWIGDGYFVTWLDPSAGAIHAVELAPDGTPRTAERVFGAGSALLPWAVGATASHDVAVYANEDFSQHVVALDRATFTAGAPQGTTLDIDATQIATIAAGSGELVIVDNNGAEHVRADGTLAGDRIALTPDGTGSPSFLGLAAGSGAPRAVIQTSAGSAYELYATDVGGSDVIPIASWTAPQGDSVAAAGAAGRIGALYVNAGTQTVHVVQTCQ
jgi:hypothetical protein